MLVKKPWGFYKQLTFNQNCTVKLITIYPNQETSLHYHNLRDDMWIILDEGLKVQIDEKVIDTKSGDEFVIPAESLHRIISKGKEGRILEIEYGYTADGDTFRVEDDYGRKIIKGKEDAE